MIIQDALLFFNKILKHKLCLCLSILTPGLPIFYYIYGAKLGLLLHGAVPVMGSVNKENKGLHGVSLANITALLRPQEEDIQVDCQHIH